nr:MAG TPA: hypothetical protein [Caudoviricetes sp.]
MPEGFLKTHLHSITESFSLFSLFIFLKDNIKLPQCIPVYLKNACI